MHNLPYPDRLYFRAAEGWLGLGDTVAAAEELDKITSQFHTHPEVRVLRWFLLAHAQKWEEALLLAEGIAQAFPGSPRGWIQICKTLKCMGRVQQAYDLAMRKLEHFAEHWEFFYDAACYACLLGKRVEAEMCLLNAIVLGNAKMVTRLAIADPDLKTLWKPIGSCRLKLYKRASRLHA